MISPQKLLTIASIAENPGECGKILQIIIETLKGERILPKHIR